MRPHARLHLLMHMTIRILFTCDVPFSHVLVSLRCRAPRPLRPRAPTLSWYLAHMMSRACGVLRTCCRAHMLSRTCASHACCHSHLQPCFHTYCLVHVLSRTRAVSCTCSLVHMLSRTRAVSHTCCSTHDVSYTCSLAHVLSRTPVPLHICVCTDLIWHIP